MTLKNAFVMIIKPCRYFRRECLCVKVSLKYPELPWWVENMYSKIGNLPKNAIDPYLLSSNVVYKHDILRYFWQINSHCKKHTHIYQPFKPKIYSCSLKDKAGTFHHTTVNILYTWTTFNQEWGSKHQGLQQNMHSWNISPAHPVHADLWISLHWIVSK